MGLITGPVIAGRVTDDLQMDVTAIGDTINRAARIEEAPGGAEHLAVDRLRTQRPTQQRLGTPSRR
jgi:class 3 adenylate cyclase